MLRKKSLLVLVAILIILLAALFILNQKEASKNSPEPSQNNGDLFTMEESGVIAKDWIENNAPTYKFDGQNLKLKDSYEIGLKEIDPSVEEGGESKCEDCYEFAFDFSSRQAGYGNREGEMLAQVITPHTLKVRVESGEVTRAVTDQKYDELNQEMLQEETSLNQEDVRTYIKENISDLAPEQAVLGGNFYVIKMIFLSENNVLVQYEDGHKAYVGKAEYTLSGDNINVRSFENVDIEVKKLAEINFSEAGNITFGNDQNPQLVYEKPGAPALTKNINFNESITCYNFEANSLVQKNCEQVNWEEGDRVKVFGLEEENDFQANFIVFLK